MNTFYIFAVAYFTIGAAVSIALYGKVVLSSWELMLIPFFWPLGVIALILIWLESATDDEEDRDDRPTF